MHTEKEHIDPDELAKMGYERRDINLPALRKTILIFYAFAMGSSIIGAIVLYWGVHLGPIRLDPYVPNTTVQQKNDAANAVGRIFPSAPYPLVQGNVTAKLDIQTMRQAEDERLSGTGYVNEDKTKAYIPIEDAMKIILQRGLPKTDTEPAVVKGNDMEPFGTGTVTPPPVVPPAGETMPGTPGTTPGTTPAHTNPTSTGTPLSVPPTSTP
ncbi:hypothetical protein BH11ARM2_BH11ARM2_32310 [soil metagenome]